MSLYLWPALLTCWGIAAFWLLLIRYTLHDFSRSRLEAICEEKKQMSRFGDILKAQDQTLIIVDLGLLTSLIFALFVFNQNGFFASVNQSNFSQSTLWFTELVLIFVSLFFILVIIPWSTARVAGEIMLYHSWSLIKPLLVLFRPFILLRNRPTNSIHRMAGQQEPTLTDSETIAERIAVGD
ncbi:MAG: hypothetical protein R3C11_20680 [Planctomycetaceae bacterium]